jgi:hypothetical protein
MKRLITECRPFAVEKYKGTYNYKFQLVTPNDAENNEVIIGTFNDEKYFFIVKIEDGEKNIYALSHDDFSLSYMDNEIGDLQFYSELDIDPFTLSISEDIDNA